MCPESVQLRRADTLYTAALTHTRAPATADHERGAPKTGDQHTQHTKAIALYMCTVARRRLLAQCEDLAQPKHMCGSHRYAHCWSAKRSVECGRSGRSIHAQAHDNSLTIALRNLVETPLKTANDCNGRFVFSFPFSFYSIFSTLASSIRYAMTIFLCFLYLRYAYARRMGGSETAFTCCRRADSLLTYTDANEPI